MRKSIVLILVAVVVPLFVSCRSESASDWLERLGNSALDRAETRSKSKVEEKVNSSVDSAVDTSFEQAEQGASQAVESDPE